MNPFDQAWDLVKAIGPDDFTYAQNVAPISVHRTNPYTGHGWTQDDPGMQMTGFMDVDNAIRHLEGAEDIESLARRHGYNEDTAMQYDENDELTIMQDPAYWMTDHDYETQIPVGMQEQVARGLKTPVSDKRRPYMADEIRENLEPYGRLWGEGFGSLNQRALLDVLEGTRDAGTKRTPVSRAIAGLQGQGSMVDVNPAFRGLGLGSSTLAAILENTGRVMDSRLSPSGFGLAHSTRRQLEEEGIPVRFNMDEAMKTPIMSEEEQKRNWREGDARFPHQGKFEMNIPTDLRGSGKVLPKSPKRIGWQPTTLNRIIEGEKELTEDQMRRLVESHQRALNLKHDWLNDIRWTDD
jgi:GNAT superfamily N-acetyltransferase